jgi:hypothetical protein
VVAWLLVLLADGSAVSPGYDEVDAQTGGNCNNHACAQQVRTLAIKLNATMLAEEVHQD